MISPTPAQPAAWTPLETALRLRRPVHVRYHGRRRLICPHALGWKNRRPMVLGFQVGGETSTGALDADPRKRWRLMYVDEIQVVIANTATPWQTASNYNPSHPFNSIDELTVAVSDNPRNIS